MQKTFDELRPAADEAIRAGLSVGEFLELQDIPKNHWYEVKPKDFDWVKIQRKLGIKRNYSGPKNKKKAAPLALAKKEKPKRKAHQFYLDRIVALAQSLETAEIGEESSDIIEEIGLLHAILVKVYRDV